MELKIRNKKTNTKKHNVLLHQNLLPTSLMSYSSSLKKTTQLPNPHQPKTPSNPS